MQDGKVVGAAPCARPRIPVAACPANKDGGPLDVRGQGVGRSLSQNFTWRWARGWKKLSVQRRSTSRLRLPS